MELNLSSEAIIPNILSFTDEHLRQDLLLKNMKVIGPHIPGHIEMGYGWGMLGDIRKGSRSNLEAMR
jgi:hypothetical protein